MKLKALSAVAAIALLAACESAPDTTGTNTGAGAGGPRPGSQEDLIATAGSDRVFFDFDSSVIRADGRTTLDRQAAWFATNAAVRATIEGHTDERGTREYNLALGQRRANATRDYLVARGVAGARLATISYGKDRPASVGSDEGAWAQNRRAVTVVN
jgi:peptidoglycan-associated lipoprotein